MEIINVLRDEKEMSASEMAKKLGITQTDVSHHLNVTL